LPALTPTLLTLATLLFAMTVAGCARHSERQTRAAPPETRTCQSAWAQPEPQSPPDCEFKESELKTVDPAQFARLKAAYERQCYRRAERAERERQRRLRASKGC
jgi:hypothetical protein